MKATIFKIALLIIAIIVGFMYYGCESNPINPVERETDNVENYKLQIEIYNGSRSIFTQTVFIAGYDVPFVYFANIESGNYDVVLKANWGVRTYNNILLSLGGSYTLHSCINSNEILIKKNYKGGETLFGVVKWWKK